MMNPQDCSDSSDESDLDYKPPGNYALMILSNYSF